MGGGNFDELLRIVGFLAATHVSGRCLQAIGLSPILGYIAVGIALGPDVANLLHDSEEHPHWFRTLGVFGVTLMIFESGMHVQFHKLKQIGFSALLVAILGTLLPIIAALLFAFAFGWPIYPDGFALGCALAPTSVGIALKLLTEAKELGSDYGQLIVTAAFVDDIFSIIALILLINLAGGSAGAVTVLLPFAGCTAFVFIGACMAKWFWPKVVILLTSKFPFSPTASMQPAQQVHLLIMLVVLIGYSWVAAIIGSHLLGAFMAGMSFCCVPRTMSIWQRQTKRASQWLIRLFFASTVAFSIPIEEMLSLQAFWKGLICGIGPCVVTKAVCGVFVGPERWLVGAAMMGRGEFAYLVAERGVGMINTGALTSVTNVTNVTNTTSDRHMVNPPMMLSKDLYAVCVWALLIAVIVAPFLFRFFLSREVAKKESTGIHGFRLKVKGQYYPGMVHEVMDVLRSMNLEATDATIETDNVVCIVTLTCSTRNQNEDLDDEKFEDVRKHVFEALDDDEGQIVITPFKDWSANGQASKAGGAFYLPSYRIIHSKTGESERQKVEDSCQRERGHYVVIKVMSDHGPDFLQQIWKILNEQHLDVRKSKMYKNGNTSLKYFYTTDSESQNFEPTPERLQKLRDRLALEFKYHGVRAKALVKTVRIENAPSIYGFTPTVEAGEHVAEFNIYNEHHHEVLQKVLMMVADDYKFDIINSTTDMHGQTGYDHTTLFALDPNWEAQIPQDEITNRLISVFRNYNLTAQVSVHVYNVNADEETNEEEVKPVVASIDQSNTIRYRTLTSKASECPEPSCALSLRVDTNDNTRTGKLVKTMYHELSALRRHLGLPASEELHELADSALDPLPSPTPMFPISLKDSLPPQTPLVPGTPMMQSFCTEPKAALRAGVSPDSGAAVDPLAVNIEMRPYHASNLSSRGSDRSRERSEKLPDDEEHVPPA